MLKPREKHLGGHSIILALYLDFPFASPNMPVIGIPSSPSAFYPRFPDWALKIPRISCTTTFPLTF
jgi:hypothetical protein